MPQRMAFPPSSSPSIFPSFFLFKAQAFLRFHVFHTSGTSAAAEDNHYETFGLPKHATRAEIKKRYFELSKVHHPDHNHNDPHASKRFIKISSAYAVLGNEKHREKYDQGLQRRPRSSSGPIGARPASGLSRRRTRSNGLPPSFFRGVDRGTLKGKPVYAGQGATGGGFGVGGPTTGRNDDVPHFNYGQKYREHEHLQNRWAHRAKHRRSEPDVSIIFQLVGVTTILLSVISVAACSGP